MVVLLAVLPSTTIFGYHGHEIPTADVATTPLTTSLIADTQSGTLDPVLIKLTGSSNGMTQTGTLRTDVNSAVLPNMQ